MFDDGRPTPIRLLSASWLTFDDLDSDAQALVMVNANPLDQSGLVLVTDAVTSIEALNAVIEGGSGDIATAIADVRAKVEATPDDIILGGSGFGLVVADGEEASPVNLGMAQRMDELFAGDERRLSKMLFRQQIVGLSAVDIVGALSSMNVFEMDAPTDPTASSFRIHQFEHLMQMRRRL